MHTAAEVNQRLFLSSLYVSLRQWQEFKAMAFNIKGIFKYDLFIYEEF